MPVAVFAPAKVNLYLHVTGRRADGLPPTRNDLVVAISTNFGTVSEDLLNRALPVHLNPVGNDNLVLRAARLLADHAGIVPGAALHLEKRLPVAGGIGGGSSDAAAALRALRRLWRLSLDDETLCTLGARLGADVPACLYRRAVWVGGIGERLEPAGAMPQAGILLANPRRALPTATVFAHRRDGFGQAARFAQIPRHAEGLAEALASRRNELTDAAVELRPEIGAVLARLGRLPGCLLVRMSGSGATCFALFPDRVAATEGCAMLASAEPRWWCAAGGFVAEAAGYG